MPPLDDNVERIEPKVLPPIEEFRAEAREKLDEQKAEDWTRRYNEQRARRKPPIRVDRFAEGIEVPKSGYPILDRLLSSGDLLVVGAPRGIGKTWLMFSLSEILARGPNRHDRTTFFLDEFTPRRKSRVAYVHGELQHDEWTDSRWRNVMGVTNEEIGPGAIVEFFQSEDPMMLRVAQGRDLGPNLDEYVTAPRADIDTSLIDIITSGEHDVLILDPWRAFLVGGENDNDAVAAILTKLWALCQVHGVTLVLVHHMGKETRGRSAEDMWRGAGTLADRASVRITFTPFYDMDPKSLRKRNLTAKEARRYATVHFLVRNQPTPDGYHVQLNDQMRWTHWTPPYQEAMEARRAEIPLPVIVEVFEEHDGSIASIAAAERIFKDALGEEAPTRNTLKKILHAYSEGEDPILTEFDGPHNAQGYRLREEDRNE